MHARPCAMAVAGSAPDESAPGRGERPQEDRRRGTPHSPKCELPDRHVRPGARSAKPSVSPSRAELRPRGERQPARAAGGPSPRHPVWLCRHRWIVAGHTPHGRRTPGRAARCPARRAQDGAWTIPWRISLLRMTDLAVLRRGRGVRSDGSCYTANGYIPFPIDMIHRTMT
jgi:hypothetical protein